MVRRIFLWDVNSDNEPQLLFTATGGQQVQVSSWSADGALVAFTRTSQGVAGGEVGTVNIGTGEVAFHGPGVFPSMRPHDVYQPNGPTTIYRLYRAYFLREPDADGYSYWLDIYRQGHPLSGISETFTRSPEFRSTYGDVSDRDFIRLAHNNGPCPVEWWE